MAVLEGRLQRTKFFLSLLLPLLGVVSSPFAALWWRNTNLRGQFLALGFAALVATTSLLLVVTSLAAVVTWFRLHEGQLEFRRLGRRRRSVPLDAVAQVGPAPRHRGANVLLCDGSMLFLSYPCLENAEQLVDALPLAAQQDRQPLTGGLIGLAVVYRLLGQALLTSLLAAVSFGGLMCLGAAFHPAPFAGQGVFLPLGSLLLLLCAAGFYSFVINPWRGCVRWFELDRHMLKFRTVFSRSVEQRLLDELQQASTHRPDSTQAEQGSWKELRFADGRRLRLQLALLVNANLLFERLKRVVDRRKLERAISLRPLGADHPLWARVAPLLEEDERVYWLGQPDYRKLRSEMAALTVAGGLLALAGLGGAAFFLWSIRGGGVGPLFAAAAFLALAGVGLWCLRRPARTRRWCEECLYAVTSRRILISHGLAWGAEAGISRSEQPLQSIDATSARDYEVINRGRDISLGGTWATSRRNRRCWVHTGLLAPADPAAAEAAILHFIRTSAAPADA